MTTIPKRMDNKNSIVGISLLKSKLFFEEMIVYMRIKYKEMH